MTVECLKCGGAGRPTGHWKAVGYSLREGRRQVAYLKCLTCGSGFYSSLPEALRAAEPFRVEREQQRAVVSGDDFVPAPTLFHGELPMQSQGFAKVGSVVKASSTRQVLDWARRAAGERED